MANIKDIIDAKIRKLQAIRELADDPDALALMREIVLAANGRTPEKPAIKRIPLITPMEEATRRAYGEQQRVVEDVLRSAPEPVGTEWIVNKMIERGYEFKAANPRVAVNECLRVAKEAGRAKIAKQEGVSNYWIAI